MTEERYEKCLQKKEKLEKEKARLENLIIHPEEINPILLEKGSAPVKGAVRLTEILRRPEISYKDTEAVDPGRPELTRHEAQALEVRIKYAGYIDKQNQQVERFKKLENRRLDPDMDYEKIEGLRIEARQKLNAQKPISIGQASRISGVSPADINVLLIHLERSKR